MTGPKNALAAWGSSALRPVELPTGMKALVKLPNVAELLEADAFPQELRNMATKYAVSGITISTLEGDELKAFVRLTYELIARSLKYLAPADSQAWEKFRENGGNPADEGWQAVAISPSELRQMDVDQSDLDALGALAGRMKSPNEITAMSRFDRALLTEHEAIEQAKGGDAVGDHGPFRGQPAGVDGGADSEDVRLPAVDAPGDRGSRHRVRSRRGTRA